MMSVVMPSRFLKMWQLCCMLTCIVSHLQSSAIQRLQLCMTTLSRGVQSSHGRIFLLTPLWEFMAATYT